MTTGALPAGEFAAWLDQLQDALAAGGTTDVPCGSCTACCQSSQFVHVAPDEADALAHIPPELLFPAPRLPRGHLVMGYDERGRCPMLGEHGCSIYAHRPRTCRTFDCRVFTATGIAPEQPAIAERTSRWRFDYRGDESRRLHEATRAAAESAAHRDGSNSTERALAAVRVVLRGRSPG